MLAPVATTRPFTTSVDEITESEWNDLLTRFADASIYQTWAYGAVSWGERNLSHLVLKDSGQVIAMAQLRIARIPILRRGAAYLRWGPLWRRQDHSVDLQNLRLITDCLVQEYVQKRKLLLRVLPNVFSEDEYGLAAKKILLAAGLVSSKATKPYR
ncbi:MAG TPA: hypothetical protein VG146_08140, partial [Verrucomicrobiae bacterium]|nr:hypothetical protein [Verrucomicrobiae bacterium]